MFVSVCGNLQHMTKHKVFKVFCFFTRTSAMMQNAANISDTNCRVMSMLTRKRRVRWALINSLINKPQVLNWSRQ